MGHEKFGSMDVEAKWDIKGTLKGRENFENIVLRIDGGQGRKYRQKRWEDMLKDEAVSGDLLLASAPDLLGKANNAL